MGDNDDAWRMCCQGLPRNGTHVGDSERAHGWSWTCLWQDKLRLAGSGFLGGPRHLLRALRAKKLHNSICHHYIRVLLTKTNSMVYNMLYKYRVKAVEVCSLSETMSSTWVDDNDALLGVDRGCQGCGICVMTCCGG